MAKDKSNQLRIRLSISAVGTYDYLRTDIVPEGERWCLQHIAYENETGARGTFRRYIEGHGYNHYLGEVQGPGSAELLTWDGELWLEPGERHTIRQASATAADVISAYITGYKVFTD